MSADAQFRSLIDRILRLKEEQDTLAADIREIYAEAKGNGYDKTAMGQVVAHLRKVEKVGIAAIEEGETIFDLYLSAYQRTTGTENAIAHTHEKFPPHDAVTGELTEEQESTDMVVGLAGPACAQDAAAANFKPARNPAIVPPDAAGQTGGEATTPLDTSPVVIPDYVPTFLIKKPALRPHCLNPGENCGGQGVRHCHSCVKAMAESGVAA